MFPLRTERLTIRALREEDVATVAAYRNDPDVARYQDWPLPYDPARTVARIRDSAGAEPDVAGGVNLAIEHAGCLIGDLYARSRDGLAEIGWTLRHDAWGHGFAGEAATALVSHLFDHLGAHRIEADMHVDNVASARVCESLGMTFEALTRMDFQGRDGWEDDQHYAMLRSDWEAWLTRPRNAPGAVRLVPIDEENVEDYLALRGHHSQRRFVRPVVEALATTAMPRTIRGLPFVAESYGVEADGVPVGFTQLCNRAILSDEPYLWRLMVDRMHQRRGIGHAVLTRLADLVRARGGTTLVVSYGGGPGSPEPLYRRFGFEPTGEVDGHETVARLTL